MKETRFARYLRLKGIPHKAMALRLKLHESSVSRISSGKMTPTLETAVLIEDVTKRYVKPRDLLIAKKARRA